jgi:hypothetical protein
LSFLVMCVCLVSTLPDQDMALTFSLYIYCVQVMSQMYAGEHVKHAIKRTYSNWKGASGTFFAQLRTQTEGEEGLDLTVYQRAQARAVQLFKMIDTDGSGVMLHPLRTVAPSFPPRFHALISVSFPTPFFSPPLVSNFPPFLSLPLPVSSRVSRWGPC